MAILVFEHSGESGSDRLGEILRDNGHRLRVLQLHEGDPVPGDLDDVDAIVATGGPQAAFDDSHAYFAPEMALMKQANAVGMPIVGLCLGSQLLARALGGTVEKNPAGIELGWHEVKLTPVGREDPLYAGIGWTTMQMHYHSDHVSALPPGARLLASSQKTKTQSWALGLRTYGFQFHPEASLQTIEGWTNDTDALRQAGLTSETLRSQTKQNYAAFERVTNRLFEQIALLLMPVDRRYQGLVKDLHY